MLIFNTSISPILEDIRTVVKIEIRRIRTTAGVIQRAAQGSLWQLAACTSRDSCKTRQHE